jgi:hypothetical protein
MIHYFLKLLSKYCPLSNQLFSYKTGLIKTDLITGENIYNIYKLNWACRVRDILFKYGFHNIWISQYVNHVDFFICEFKQRMKDNFISEMNTFFNESPKCHLYRYIFDNNVLQFYLDRPLNYIYKPYIYKMRISAHNLNIETGRFYNLDLMKECVVCVT